MDRTGSGYELSISSPAQAERLRWREVITAALGAVEPIGTPERVRLAAAGALRVGELAGRGDGGATRAPRHIRSSDEELCKLDLIVAGGGVVEQDGRAARVGPGDLTFVDLSRPARWHMSDVHLIATVFPRALLPLPADEIARLTAMRIPADHGGGALIAGVTRSLAAHLDDFGATERTRLGGALMDVLATALAGRLGSRAALPPETRQRALVTRIHTFIEAHLGDPDLSPAMIASATHVSVRYLHKLFESENTTVAGEIRRRRLERCRRDLMDPALALEPAGAIGARWTFANPAHFSRLFRTAYGEPPAAFRHAAAAANVPMRLDS